MAYHYDAVSVYIGEYGTPVECEYEPIHIKWETGYADIVPPALFTDADLTKIRKVFRMSAQSDLMHSTNTISAWRKAIKAERDYQFKVFSVITDEYNAAYAELVESAVKPDKKRGKRLSELQKRKTQAIKRLDARKKKVDKAAEILEEMAAKYK